MELAIPIIALGGLYIISNQNSDKKLKEKIYKENERNEQNGYNGGELNDREYFTNMGKTSLMENILPNTNTPVQNYPVINNDELVNNVLQYPNPNIATAQYFNQNNYENREVNGESINNNIQNIYSLSGNYMNTQDFIHNNMVPFEGGKPKGELYNNRNTESILDTYIGSGNHTIKKVEQAPLFNPQENVQWSYGVPNMNDFYQSRVNPSLKNNAVKPFDSVYVGPGLDKGYSNEGTNGYNSGMDVRDKWMPKNVDELRVDTNPKLEYSLDDLQGPANSQIKSVGLLGKVEKYAPDRFYINNQDRWFTTTGAEKGQRLNSDEVLKYVNRDNTTTFQQGTPSSTIKNASYIPSKHTETKRIQLEGFDAGPSNSQGCAPYQYLDNQVISNKNSTTNTNRNITNNKNMDIFSATFNRSIGAAITPIMDLLRPVKREEYSENIRIYGNNKGEINKSYVIQKSDVPKTTIKETTIYEPHGYIGNQVNDIFNNIQTIYDNDNQRTTTSIDYYGNVGGKSNQYGDVQYDNYYRQTNNINKEQTIVGRTNTGNTNVLNTNINMRSSKPTLHSEGYIPPVSSVVNQGPLLPNINLHYKQEYDNNKIGVDRINGNLLKSFIDNPYTHNINPPIYQ